MNIRGYSIPDGSSLTDWEYMLKEWLVLVELYCQLMPGKAPYWHNESANVGIFSGAAQRCGWLAIEELPVGKKDYTGQSWHGRLDLWLCSTARPHTKFAIEFKMGWSPLNGIRGVSTANDYLKKACNDASNVVVHDNENRVGVVFCVPRLNALSGSNIESSIEELLDGLQSRSYDAMAYCFPEVTRQLKEKSGKDIYPGIILLARTV